MFTAIYFLVRWIFVYEDMKRAAAAAGTRLLGSWSEALHTWYSIPMWETLMVCMLYVFLTWFVLVVPGEVSPSSGRDSSSQDG